MEQFHFSAFHAQVECSNACSVFSVMQWQNERGRLASLFLLEILGTISCGF